MYSILEYLNYGGEASCISKLSSLYRRRITVCKAHTRSEFPLNIDYGACLKNTLCTRSLAGLSVLGRPAEFLQTEREGEAELTFTLFQFDDDRITTGDVRRAMARLGYRPAEAIELLAFRVAEQEVHRYEPIVALGSCCEVAGEKSVAAISFVEGCGWKIDLYPSCGGKWLANPIECDCGAWSDSFIFAAVLEDCTENCLCRTTDFNQSAFEEVEAATA